MKALLLTPTLIFWALSSLPALADSDALCETFFSLSDSAPNSIKESFVTRLATIDERLNARDRGKLAEAFSDLAFLMQYPLTAVAAAQIFISKIKPETRGPMVKFTSTVILDFEENGLSFFRKPVTPEELEQIQLAARIQDQAKYLYIDALIDTELKKLQVLAGSKNPKYAHFAKEILRNYEKRETWDDDKIVIGQINKRAEDTMSERKPNLVKSSLEYLEGVTSYIDRVVLGAYMSRDTALRDKAHCYLTLLRKANFVAGKDRDFREVAAPPLPNVPENLSGPDAIEPGFNDRKLQDQLQTRAAERVGQMILEVNVVALRKFVEVNLTPSKFSALDAASFRRIYGPQFVRFATTLWESNPEERAELLEAVKKAFEPPSSSSGEAK